MLSSATRKTCQELTEVEGGGVRVGGLAEAVLFPEIEIWRQLKGLETAGLKVRNVAMTLSLQNTRLIWQ